MLVWQAHKTKVRSLVFSPDGTRIATCADKSGDVGVWHAPTGNAFPRFGASPSWVHAIAFFPDGQHIAGHLNGPRVRVWNVETGNVVAILDTAVRNHFDMLAVSPSGSRLLTACEEGIAEWKEPTSGTLRNPDDNHDVWPPGTSRIGFSTTGKYFCVSGWHFHLHTPDLKKEVRKFRDPTSGERLGASVNCFAFNGDDSRLILGLGQRAVVWSPDDLEASPVLIVGHGKKVMGVGFLPGGQVLTAGMDGTARVWDQNTGAELKTLTWGIGKVSAAAVSPDGTLCAVGSVDGRVLVWDIDS